MSAWEHLEDSGEIQNVEDEGRCKDTDIFGLNSSVCNVFFALIIIVVTSWWSSTMHAQLYMRQRNNVLRIILLSCTD